MYTTPRVIHPLVTDIEVKAELTLLVEALELPASASAPITPATSKTVVVQHPSVTSPFRLPYVLYICACPHALLSHYSYLSLPCLLEDFYSLACSSGLRPRDTFTADAAVFIESRTC